MEIDLLLVDAQARRQGIGKKLVENALKTFQNVTICNVYTPRFENDGVQAFYKKMGFVCTGLGPTDKINLYGVSYAAMYFHYQLKLPRMI